MNVVVNQQLSRPCDVVSEVIQGSVLGPLLFLLFINFLTHNISSHTKNFANDLKLYILVDTNSVHTVHQNMSSCHRDIDNLYKVAFSCCLSIN